MKPILRSKVNGSTSTGLWINKETRYIFCSLKEETCMLLINSYSKLLLAMDVLISCSTLPDATEPDNVPCKATKGKGYGNTGYLCVNKNSFWSSDSTYTKTNIYLLNTQKLSTTQKNIVVLLKEWKHNRDVPLPSYLLENLVQDSYQYNRRCNPRRPTAKLVMVYEGIAQNLDGICIRSVENTNDILTNIPDADKALIINACKFAVADYYCQQNSILNTIME